MLQKVCSVVVTNSDGEILLGKRKKQSSPWWGLPGGKVEVGESLEDTVKRESLEECGIFVDELIEVLTCNYDKYEVHVFRANKYYGVPKLLEPDKFEKWEWFKEKPNESAPKLNEIFEMINNARNN